MAVGVDAITANRFSDLICLVSSNIGNFTCLFTGGSFSTVNTDIRVDTFIGDIVEKGVNTAGGLIGGGINAIAALSGSSRRYDGSTNVSDIVKSVTGSSEKFNQYLTIRKMIDATYSGNITIPFTINCNVDEISKIMNKMSVSSTDSIGNFITPYTSLSSVSDILSGSGSLSVYKMGSEIAQRLQKELVTVKIGSWMHINQYLIPMSMSLDVNVNYRDSSGLPYVATGTMSFKPFMDPTVDVVNSWFTLSSKSDGNVVSL